MHSALVGFGLGFFVALQLGPMSFFLIRTTLRGGWKRGLSVGAGIAVIDGLYAAAGAGGVASLLGVYPLRFVLGLAGAGVLVGLGARTIYSAFRVRIGAEVHSDVVTIRRAFLTSLAGTASNPLTIASWAAVFSAVSTADAARTTREAMTLVAGVAVGSLTWGSTLATAVAVARHALGERAMRLADFIAGFALIGFGGVLACATVHDR